MTRLASPRLLATFAAITGRRTVDAYAVDRRFDRARYDGQHTADAFAQRLRAETDIDAVLDDLSGTTGSAVAPASIVVWLRTTAAAR